MARGTNRNEVQLTQYSDLASVAFNGNAQSDFFDTLGARGLVIYIPSGWASADILFVTDAKRPGYLATETGALVRLSGITPGRWHVAPDNAWAVGAFARARLESVAVGGTAGVTQSDNVIIARMR